MGHKIRVLLSSGDELFPHLDSCANAKSSLCTDTLPKDHGLRLRLINAYFERNHYLRCLSFIHRPSFMQSLESASIAQDYGEPLVYIICALGARYAISSLQN